MFGVRRLKSGNLGAKLGFVQPLRQGGAQHAGMVSRLMKPTAMERMPGKRTFTFSCNHKHTAHTLMSTAGEKAIEGSMGLILPHPVQIEARLGVYLATREPLTRTPIKSCQRWWRGLRAFKKRRIRPWARHHRHGFRLRIRFRRVLGLHRFRYRNILFRFRYNLPRRERASIFDHSAPETMLVVAQETAFASPPLDGLERRVEFIVHEAIAPNAQREIAGQAR